MVKNHPGIVGYQLLLCQGHSYFLHDITAFNRKLDFSHSINFYCFSQVTKWLMSKGQVLTWTTYDTFLLALFMDGRADEAESIWSTVIQTHTRSVPKRLFSRMILMYDTCHRPDKVLEVHLNHFHFYVVSSFLLFQLYLLTDS